MPALYRAGLASQPTSVARDDGLRLLDSYMTAVVRCAPPDNRPFPGELTNCSENLHRELQLLTRTRVIVALGQIAHAGVLRATATLGWNIPTPRPRFGHGAVSRLQSPDGRTVTLIASYHPSRQNTQTGKLTRSMLDKVMRAAAKAVGAR
jgi:uracil-DNA glycosylase family 4